jgi:hypothetical protein
MSSHCFLTLCTALAVQARIQGTVVLRVAIERGVVKNAEELGEASAVLVAVAEDNVSSWRFAVDVHEAIQVTYRSICRGRKSPVL